MKNALISEYRKLVSTRMWWLLAIVLVAYLGFMGVVLAAVTTIEPPEGSQAVQLHGEAAALSVYSAINGIGYVFPLIIGSLAMTTEFRHHTITESLLVEPRRSMFLSAKLLATVPVGVVYGVVGTAALAAGGGVILAWRGDGAYLTDSDVIVALLCGVLVTVLWAIIGVGVGSVLTNQVAAIIVILAFTQFVEPVARTLLGSIDGTAAIAKFLPGAAADAVIGGSAFAGFGAEIDILPRLGGFAVLVAYAVGLALIGRVTTLRRDLA